MSDSNASVSSSSASAVAKHRDRLGRIEEVLIEGPSKKDPSVLSGRTRQNKLVHFTPPTDMARRLRTGSYATVEITKAADHHLFGQFVEHVADAQHTVRIPVASL